MPPSPALRCSPGRELRAESHKRGRSLESGMLFREKDDDLALFNEMQSKERENFLLQSSDDFEDTFSSKLRNFSDVKLGISIPGRGESSDLLNADGDKNDYDWLLTPPDTPLFPSLDNEPPPMNSASRGRPRSKPISISRSSTMEKSYRSSRGSASPNRLSPSPRSGNNTFQSRGKPSSAPNSSPTQSLWHATPTRRPSPPPSKPSTPAARSSNVTPRRMSTGSNGPVVSPGIRGTSPIKTSRGNSASPKIRAWQTNIPGFSSEAPPNLRTSLADRPASYVRGTSPASRNGKDSASKFNRQSMSPTASRTSSSIHSHDRDQFSSRSKGSIVSSGDDDVDSLQSIPVGSLDRLSSRRIVSYPNNRALAYSKKPARMASSNSTPKRSFDSSLRQMDRKSPQNMFRPLMSSVPSTTFYVGKANSAHRSLVSRNSSVTTSSNASSDQGGSFALDTQGIDHNQDHMASETEKASYPDIQEEVFEFDKMDVVNANVHHGINEESVDVQHIESRVSKGDFGLTESEDSIYHGINTEVNVNSETGDFEITVICSHCGCRYEAIDQAEKDIRLCPECSRKDMLLRVVIPETTLAVAVDSSVFSLNNSADQKPLAKTDQLMVAPELAQTTDVGDLRFNLDKQDDDESKTSCSELVQDHSGQSPLPISLGEGDEQMPVKRGQMDQSKANSDKPDNYSGDQQLYPCNDLPNLKVELLEGTGISVLLKRSSSSKGPVVRSRTFTASTISYDDLSLARDSINSMRGSTGLSSYSASSSVDFSSARQMEFHVQRQLSNRKFDVDHGYDTKIKSRSIGSSFSEISSHSHRGLGLTMQETSSRNSDSVITDEIPIVTQEMQASEIIVTNVINASSLGSVVVDEDKLEYHASGKVTDACNSGLLSQAVVQSDDNSMASLLEDKFPNHGDCISYENVEDYPNDARNLSATEASVMIPGPSFDEKHDVLISGIDGLDAVMTTKSSTITESEVERENCCQNNQYHGAGDIDLSLLLKNTVDGSQESSVSNPADDNLAISVAESNCCDNSYGIEESTVTVECQGASNTRSLTLEEATDTILFCSSIIHDLAYQAATIAMEKECSGPLEGSEPTVTIVEKPNSGRKDLRSRTVGKRTSKPQKVTQSRVETDVKSPSGKTENDENIDEYTKNNVGLPNKVDSMKPPKLESKCNCTIM